MIDPRSSELFVYTHLSESGIEAAVFDSPSVQRSRWFERPVPGVCSEGRYVPLYADFGEGPPELTVIDLLNDEHQRLVPATTGGPAPVVDEETGEVIVATGPSVQAVSPDGNGRRILGEIVRCGDDGTKQGRPRAVAGFSRSIDGDKIGLGFRTAETHHVGALETATGAVASWHERSRRISTVRFSPTDPSLLLFAVDAEPATSVRSAPAAWLAREGLGARPLNDLLPERHGNHWWDSDGTGIWYVAPGSGVEYLNLELGRREVVWRSPARRAHATGDGRLIAATSEGENPQVIVYDRGADASAVVAHAATSTPSRSVQPQFVGDDEYLAYTTEFDGEPTVAISPVAAIRERL